MTSPVSNSKNSENPPVPITSLPLTLTISYKNGIDGKEGFDYAFDAKEYNFAYAVNVDCDLNCKVVPAEGVTETFTFVGYTWNGGPATVTPPSAEIRDEPSNAITLVINFEIPHDAIKITFNIQPSVGELFYADPQEDNDPPLK